MKLHFLALLGAIWAWSTAVSAAPVTIDFEGLTSGTAVTDQYAADGVIFSSDGDAATPPVIANIYGPGNQLADLSRTLPDTTFNIRADFTGLVSNVMLDVTAADGARAIASIFASDGTLINSITTGLNVLGTYINLDLGGTDVAYAIFTTDQPVVAAAIIDNLSYQTAAVPVPAAFPLLLGALGGLGLMRRRRRG